MIKKLHFRVHPNIISVAREHYLYNNRIKDAYEFIETLSGGVLGISQATKLLEGDAYLTTEDDGETLNYIEKEDAEYKKEFLKHKEFLKTQKEREERKKEESENYEDDIEEEKPSILSVSPDKMLEAMTRQSNIKIGCLLAEKNDKINNDMAKKFFNKQYEFDFNGHHYTYNDNARNQSECPHCGFQSTDNMWRMKDKAFIGKIKLNDYEYALCFECPKCFEQFYFHNDVYFIEKYAKLGELK